MCPPVIAAALIGVAGSAYIAKEQGRKQEQLAEKQAEEARRLREEQQAKFLAEQRAAQATPTLLRNATQSGMGKGIKIAKKGESNSSSYGGSSSIGTGGASGTGLNIAS